MATDACRKGRVTIDDVPVKPSRNLKLNEIVFVRTPPIQRSFKVTGLLQKRVGAKLAVDYVKEITPEEELMKLEISQTSSFYYREKGAGRPTKKERRVLDKLSGPSPDDD